MARDKVVSLMALPNTSSVKFVSRGVLLESLSTTIKAGKLHTSTSQSLGLFHSPSLNNAIFAGKEMQARVMHHVCLCLLSLSQPFTFRTLPLQKIVSRWQTDCFPCGLPAGSRCLGSGYVFWGGRIRRGCRASAHLIRWR